MAENRDWCEQAAAHPVLRQLGAAVRSGVVSEGPEATLTWLRTATDDWLRAAGAVLGDEPPELDSDAVEPWDVAALLTLALYELEGGEVVEDGSVHDAAMQRLHFLVAQEMCRRAGVGDFQAEGPLLSASSEHYRRVVRARPLTEPELETLCRWMKTVANRS
jgi:hypothetical protein